VRDSEFVNHSPNCGSWDKFEQIPPFRLRRIENPDVFCREL
jgi:hypothetical protein